MKHELPPLPYDYNALEPYYDKETVRIHHDKHHATYVNNLNKAEEELAKARETGDYALIQHWEKSLAFNGSGDLLHTLFWESMTTHNDRGPRDGLLESLNKSFGSVENFQKQFSAAAVAVEGSGWALLGYQPAFDNLYVLQVENHQKLTLWGIRPILTLDVWEHAYYLKYQNRRAEWAENWWHIVNWENAAMMLSDAKSGITVPHTK